MRKGIALIVGVTGISGYNLANVLVADGWTVYGLARHPLPQDGVIPVATDLLDADRTRNALRDLPITHVFFCTWTRRDTERENIEANGAMMRHLCDGLRDAPLQHMALVTGTKHYLGAFENYGSGEAETPFRESEPRQPGENFYYTLEDLLFAHAERHGFGWSVHRSHTMIGMANGSNAMNMGVTLAVYASLCKHAGQPFVFPASQAQWNSLTDLTDAGLLGRQLAWAGLKPGSAQPGLQHGQRRCVPLALDVGRNCGVLRTRRRALPRHAAAAGSAPDQHRSCAVGRTGGKARSGGIGRQSTGLVVAHRC